MEFYTTHGGETKKPLTGKESVSSRRRRPRFTVLTYMFTARYSDFDKFLKAFMSHTLLNLQKKSRNILGKAFSIFLTFGENHFVRQKLKKGPLEK